MAQGVRRDPGKAPRQIAALDKKHAERLSGLTTIKTIRMWQSSPGNLESQCRMFVHSVEEKVLCRREGMDSKV
jgi:hypothetical protein